jgi:hypothetical protein
VTIWDFENQIEQRASLFSKVLGWIRNIRKQIQIALQVLTKETCVSVQKVFHQCVLPVYRPKRILLIGQVGQIWLINAGLVYKVERIEKPNYPISSYADHTFFKLYMSDIGLLRRHADLPSSIIFGDEPAYKEFKGAMAENFVACELKRIFGKLKDKDLYYWTAEASGKAEVDFIEQDDEKHIIPIEVKSGTAKHARSITQYCKSFNPEKFVLNSLDEMTNRIMPLYAFWKYKDWINKNE